jgi:hypothetical protein
MFDAVSFRSSLELSFTRRGVKDLPVCVPMALVRLSRTTTSWINYTILTLSGKKNTHTAARYRSVLGGWGRLAPHSTTPRKTRAHARYRPTGRFWGAPHTAPRYILRELYYTNDRRTHPVYSPGRQAAWRSLL